jgi:hypothetical protein
LAKFEPPPTTKWRRTSTKSTERRRGRDDCLGLLLGFSGLSLDVSEVRREEYVTCSDLTEDFREPLIAPP